MAVEAEKSGPDGKLWSLFKNPFGQSRNASSSSSSSSSSTLSSMHNVHQLGQTHESVERAALHSASTVSYVTKSLLPARRRLRLDPANKLFFPCTPLTLSALIIFVVCIMVLILVIYFIF